jgi:hypothetical protein
MSKFLLNLLLQISKALENSKFQFLILKFFFLTFEPTDLAANSAFGPASPLASLPPQAEPPPPRRPIQPVRRWRFCRNTFSLLGRAFRACRLSLVSLSSGPRLSALSLTPSRPSTPVPPLLSGHPAPRVPPSRYHPAFIFSPLIPLLNPPVFNGVKAINAGVKPQPPLPGAPPTPIKGRAPPPDFTTPLPSSLRFSPRSSLASTERRRLRFCTAIAQPPRRHPSSGEARAELPVLLSLFCAPRR